MAEYAAWYATCIPLIGIVIIGLLAGCIGTFAFLQKQTMLGDAVAHAALPGICFAFLCTHSGAIPTLIFGGFCTGLCAVVLVMLLTRYTSLGSDAVLGTILSVFFGGGLVLLTHIQKMPLAAPRVLTIAPQTSILLKMR